jgi:hypothetical protein
VSSGATRLRIVNLSPAAGAVDVFITAPNADLATAAPVGQGIPVRGSSPYITTVVPGTYELRAVPTGTAPANRASSVLVDIASLGLVSGAARTIVLADRAQGGSPSTAFVLTDQ